MPQSWDAKLAGEEEAADRNHCIVENLAECLLWHEQLTIIFGVEVFLRKIASRVEYFQEYSGQNLRGYIGRSQDVQVGLFKFFHKLTGSFRVLRVEQIGIALLFYGS